MQIGYPQGLDQPMLGRIIGVCMTTQCRLLHLDELSCFPASACHSMSHLRRMLSLYIRPGARLLRAVISPSRHLPRRPDRQLQHFAQRGQVLVTRPTVVSFPEIDARQTDANLFGNFNRRQATLDPSVTEVTSEVGFSGQCSDPQVLGIDYILTADPCDKPVK
jgi:hypothetical protein